MALLERQGDCAVLIEDRWKRVGDEAPLPETGDVLVSLGRFLEEKQALLARAGDVAVWLRSDETPTSLVGFLDRLAMIALDFPIFRDGRSYSSARILRERMGYKGELRAIGDVLCEQLTFMLRSGFTTFEMQSARALEEFASVVHEVHVVYQPTGDGQATAIDLRLDRSQAGRK